MQSNVRRLAAIVGVMGGLGVAMATGGPLATAAEFTASMRTRADDPPTPAGKSPDKASPFEAVRWKENAGKAPSPEVQFQGVWYRPISIHGVNVNEIVDFCHREFHPRAQKRFEEDLVMVMNRMGHEVPARVRLILVSLDDNQERTVPDAPMTEANRNAIWRAAVEREGGVPPPVARAQRAIAKSLSPADATAVVDRLESLLKDSHSYSVANGIDPRAILAPVRAHIADAKDHVATAKLVELLMEAIAPIGDGHAGIEGEGVMDQHDYLGVSLMPMGDRPGTRIAALDPQHRRFLDEEYPWIVSIDGVEIERWMEEASKLVAAGSPQLVRRRAARIAGMLDLMRARLGLLYEGEGARISQITLKNDQGKTKEAHPLVASGTANRGSYEDIAEEPAPGVRYIRLPIMRGNEEFLAELRDNLLKAPGGVIIDVRGNGGGRREPIDVVGKLLLPADAESVVYNTARPLRLPGETADQLRDRMDSRGLRPLDDPRWTAAERTAIERFAKEFKPERTLADDRFHAWHYSVISPAPADAPRLRGPVVVLMDSGCFSATDIFLCAMKRLPNVTLVGVSSGGGSGLTREHNLGSGLSARLSTMVSFQPDGRLLDGRGVEPHVVIAPEAKDFAGASDAMLARALEVIASR